MRSESEPSLPSDGEAGADSEEFAEVPVPPKGSVLLGKYRVEGVVGFGGMGVVIAARHEHLGERVAIKLLLPAYAKVEEVRKRFQREAQAAYRLRSEHVCRVLDAGGLEDGTPFIAMEFLKGEDLGTMLRKRRKVSIAEAADFIVQACEALAEAHASDIVHRDLKPANLVLVKRKDGSPSVKVIDFGISKVAANDASSNLTNTFGYLGSPSYSAPEQFASTREMTAAGDVWSLGVILYQLVTGEHPFVFASDGLAQMAATITYEPHVPMTTRDASVDRAFEAVVNRCLEKDPAHRYDGAAELAQALAPFATAHAGDAISRIRREWSKKPAPAPARALTEAIQVAPPPGAPPGTIPLQAAPTPGQVPAPRLSEPPRFLEPPAYGRASAYSQPPPPGSSPHLPSTTRAGVLTVARPPSEGRVSSWIIGCVVGLVAATCTVVAVGRYKASHAAPTAITAQPTAVPVVETADAAVVAAPAPAPVPPVETTASAATTAPSAVPATAASAAPSARPRTRRVTPGTAPDNGPKISKDRDGKL